MASNIDFASYCCDLLASVGRCVPKRMFGKQLADLGEGEKPWLKVLAKPKKAAKPIDKRFPKKR